MKKIGFIIFGCALIGLTALTGCGGSSSSASTGVPNPMVNYATVDEARAAIDFEALVPGYVPEGFTQSAVSTIDGKLLQVTYVGGENTIIYRTAPSSQDAGDGVGISGDYNKYAVSDELSIGGTAVGLQGDAKDQWVLAQWQVGDMMYSISFNPPVSTEEMIKTVDSVDSVD